MNIEEQTSKKVFERNSDEFKKYRIMVMEEKRDFNIFLDALIADPAFASQETRDVMEAYFKKWKPKFQYLGISD